MSDALSRRQVLIGGAVLLITGCVQRSQHAMADGDQPREVPTESARGPGPDANGLWYHVAAGDTLSAISRRSGVDIDSIVIANHLTTATLSHGQQLWLPGATALSDDPVMRLSGPQEAAPEAAPEEGVVGTEHGGYVLVRRSEWAVAPIRGNNLPMNGVTRITIHHTGEEPGLEGVSELERLRRIEHYHQTSRHWAAIGYHYLVGRTGRVYEGRPLRYQGAHVSGANEHNLGISVIGDFMHQLPNATQLGALDAFLTDQRLHFRVPKGRIYGHRELGMSACPGNMLFGWVQRYRA